MELSALHNLAVGVCLEQCIAGDFLYTLHLTGHACTGWHFFLPTYIGTFCPQDTLYLPHMPQPASTVLFSSCKLVGCGLALTLPHLLLPMKDCRTLTVEACCGRLCLSTCIFAIWDSAFYLPTFAVTLLTF